MTELEAGSGRPAPRAAFRTDAEGPRPAPTRLTSFAAALPPSRQTGNDRPTAKPDVRPSKPGKKDKEELVDLRIRLPKSLRKELRVRAEAAGYTAEDAAYHLIRSWLQT